MALYVDDHPRHGHRTPCELAEEEILAALRGDSCTVRPDTVRSRFEAQRVSGQPEDRTERHRSRLQKLTGVTETGG